MPPPNEEVSASFTCRKEGRRKVLWEVDLNNPFKKFNDVRFLEQVQRVEGFSTLGQMKDEAAKMDIELYGLYDDGKPAFVPADWHSLFHELFFGSRLKIDEHDVEDREKYLHDSPEVTDMFMEYACRLCQTDVATFQSEYQIEEKELVNSEHGVAWLAANRLLGSLWIPPGPPREEEDDNGNGNANGSAGDKNGAGGEEDENGAGGNGNGDKTEDENRGNAVEVTDERKEELCGTMQRFLKALRFNCGVARAIETRKVLAIADNTSDGDLQHTNGIAAAARTDYLLASFETSTAFIKCMNAIELWSIVRNTPIVDLAVPWTQEMLKEWDITITKGFPVIKKLTAATKTNNNDTGKLKILWDSRSRLKSRVLVDPDLRQAAAKAPRCTYKHFLTILNDGRQLHSDFAHAHPLLSKPLLKNMIALR